MRRIPWLLAVLACGAACPTGKPPIIRRDSRAAVDLWGWPQDGAPDGSRLDQHRADSSPSPDAKLKNDTKQQGTSCSSNGVTFTASISPKACGILDLTVEAGTPYTWVLAGVKDAQGKVIWSPPDAPNIKCCTSWPFPGLEVPCSGAVPPFSFAFMKDATNNEAAVGNVVASCIP